MRKANRMRLWQEVGMCILLSCATLAIANAQTETSTAPKPKTSPSTSTATTRSMKHSTTTHPTAEHSSTHSTSQKSKSSHSKKSTKQAGKKRGQQAIDPTRAREIQTALIREHYMTGEPSGTWDASTQAAMQRYQADQGWQSKTTPDSRALIKLGLGPSHDHLLNPERAMTMPSAPAAANPKPDPKPALSDNKPQQ